jgi:hypothetical protein
VPRGIASISVAQEERRKWVEKLRAARMFMAVFGVFFLCAAPTVVARAVSQHVPESVVRATLVPLLLHSVLHTPVCLLMDKQFRTAAKALLWKRRCPSASHFPASSISCEPVPNQANH